MKSSIDRTRAAIPSATTAKDVDDPQTAWRTPDRRLLTKRLDDPDFVRVLTAMTTAARPVSLEIAAVLAAESETFNHSLMHSVHDRRRRGENLATDLVASALLVEALHGNFGARIAIGKLRYCRGLEAIQWTRAEASPDAPAFTLSHP